MKTILLSAALATLPFTSLFAQEESNAPQVTEQNTGSRVWQAKLPGGEYLVSLGSITSISKHTYIVGTVKVTEVVVDTTGNSLARFYAFDMVGANSEANIAKNTMNRLKELTKDGAKRAGESGTPVTKEYPRTTHAKTVEYALDDVATLNSLFNSAKKAWTRNRGSKFTVK